MTLMDIISIVSLLVGLISIVLAIYSMLSAYKAEERSKENNLKTQEMIRKFYDDTKDLLSLIDKKSAIIEEVVTKNQDTLMNTMTGLLNENLIPKKQDINEQAGMLMLQKLIENPEQFSSAIESISKLQSSQGINNKKKR